MSLPKEGAEYIEKDYKSEKKKIICVRTFADCMQIFKEPEVFFNLQLKCITHIV